MRTFYATIIIALLGAAPALGQSTAPIELHEVERGDAQRYQATSGRTASGEPYNPERFTVAHATLPFGTLVNITYRSRSVTARVNDRDTGGNLVRLSARAADQLGIPPAGGQVELKLDPGEISFLQARRDRARQPAAAVAAASAPAGGQYAVQVAAFADEGRALARAGEQRGAWVQRGQSDGKPLYRVVYGMYESPEAASRARDMLRAEGVDGFVQHVSGLPAGAPRIEPPEAPQSRGGAAAERNRAPISDAAETLRPTTVPAGAPRIEPPEASASEEARPDRDRRTRSPAQPRARW